MRVAVPEHMGVKSRQPGALAPALHDIGDPGGTHRSGVTKPEIVSWRITVLRPEAQVTVQGNRGLPAVGTGPRTAALSQDDGDVPVQVQVIDFQPSALGPTDAGVQE